ncbi:hypothetical protein [Maioricimonas rarisocia]|nr:hypothetical protein [Maioricimonas rarisocia]
MAHLLGQQDGQIVPWRDVAVRAWLAAQGETVARCGLGSLTLRLSLN